MFRRTRDIPCQFGMLQTVLISSWIAQDSATCSFIGAGCYSSKYGVSSGTRQEVLTAQYTPGHSGGENLL